MTDQEREVMKLALEALERSMEAGVTGIKVDQAIAALRQALEKPEREWQGLTDEELRQIILVATGVAEAKLKEKNHAI